MADEAIFIGYRRDDTADVAGRIYDAMARRFGRQRVFKDVDDIRPGVDFGDYIKTVLPRCRVALVLIGPHWLESKDDAGARRLDDEHDWVRVEIETALATPGLLVVPVLVNGARMPRSDEVPESIKPLLRRNAAIIRRDPDFHDDVERLASAIRSSVNAGFIDLSKIGGKAGGETRQPQRKTSIVVGGIAATLALAAIVFGFSRSPAVSSPEISEPASEISEPASDVWWGRAVVDPSSPPDFGRIFADPAELQALVTRGQELSAACQTCHTLERGGPNRTGPNLAEVFGSTPGTHPGFDYSEAMRVMGGSWDYETLNNFLASPSTAVRGTKMAFVGVRREEDRLAIIAYLRSLSSQYWPLPAPLPEPATDSTSPAPSPTPGWTP